MEQAILLFLLMLKHSIADLFLQAVRPMPNKSNYFDKGLFYHSLDHGLLTFLVVIFFTDWKWAVAVAVIDFVFHMHIDWSKTSIAKKMKWKKDSTIFWKFQTLDQMLHYATYFLIVVIIYGYTG